jgi:hypothetical protein
MSASLALCLVSHTNVGKTTLARTLLARDVGDVRDAAHVTTEVTAYPMLETAAGERLELWDTPGFGDSARLARRLARHGDPIGWFLSEVWDRFRDRALWLAQKAVRNVRDQADAVLYLVNAAEDPRDAGYLAPELEVLAWVGKPVIVLLNQTGPPRPREQELAEEQRWRDALAPYPVVRDVLSLDAFARCWVQELTLLRAVGAVLPAERRPLLDVLAQAWRDRRRAQFDEAMRIAAQPIAAAALDSAVIAPGGLGGTLETLGNVVGIRRDNAAVREAMQAMAERLDGAIVASTNALIALYGLEGKAIGEVMSRLASHVTVQAPVSEGKAAIVGGVVSGALSGLIADLASGGLTLGMGMLAGGIVGALGGAGLARGYNVVRDTTATQLRWSEDFLDGLAAGALLRYLAVAHYGRGRGQWSASEYPAFWRDRVIAALARRRGEWIDVWRLRARADPESYAARLASILRASAQDVLRDLYPGALDDAAPRVRPAP